MSRFIQSASSVVLVVLCVAAQAQAFSWDILDENYGNGSGQVAFNDVYEKGSTAWGVQADPTETLADGHTILTLAPGTGFYYPAKQSIAGMVTGNADYTLEFKLAAPTRSQINLYFSETNSTATSHWHHIMMINATYAGYQADALQDYNQRNGISQAPAGFDGGISHVYRIVRQGGTASLYLDNSLTPAFTLLNGVAGAAADGVHFMWGFGQNASSATDVNFYYVKLATGAHVPVPEPSTVVLLLTAGAGLILCAWRKRRASQAAGL